MVHVINTAVSMGLNYEPAPPWEQNLNPAEAAINQMYEVARTLLAAADCVDSRYLRSCMLCQLAYGNYAVAGVQIPIHVRANQRGNPHECSSSAVYGGWLREHQQAQTAIHESRSQEGWRCSISQFSRLADMRASPPKNYRA